MEWTAWLAYEFGKNSEPLFDLLRIGYCPDFEPVSWESIVNFFEGFFLNTTIKNIQLFFRFWNLSNVVRTSFLAKDD